ncbi:MAG: hypothetical protein V7752_20335, partial [Halopseudomonas sp.]
MNKISTIVGISAALLLSTSAVQAANKLTKLSDNVYAYMNTDDYSASNSYGANAGIVIGEKGVLVIDTQISSQRAQ